MNENTHGVSKVVVSMAIVCLLSVIAPTTFAQVENNQDEVVNILAGRNVEGPDGVLKIFRPVTKFESLNYIVDFFDLKHANADEVAAYVDEAVEFEGGISKSLEYTDPVTGKISYYLEVITTEAQMPGIKHMIGHLDKPGMKEVGGDPDFEVRMRYRRASEVGAILDGLGVNEVIADDITNTLHFEDSESKLALLNFYDVPPLQIQFKIEIIEVREEDADKIGVDWDAWKRMVGGEAQYTGGSNLNPRLDWMVSLDSSTLSDFLNYTAQMGNADIKQNAVLNINNLATGVLSNLRGVNTYSFARAPASADFMQDVEPDAGVDTTVSLISGQARSTQGLAVTNMEGITITITPVIGTDLVTADISIDAMTLNGVDAMDRPIIATQHFETNITLKNNQSLHAATIERTVTVNSRRGIPGLRDVPVVKHLFSSRTNRTESSKIFVVITPCYCESVSYDARISGGAGEILRFKDTKPPTFIPRAN